MYLSFTPRFIQQMMPQLLWRVEEAENSIYLTFDDGPIPEVTPWVLEELDIYNAQASFFCVGDNVVKYPDIFEMLKYKNHFIGSHTYNHLSGWSTNTNDYIQNVDKAASLINTKLFRPPYGRITPGQYKILKDKYQIVMWDVLSGDFDALITPQLCYDNVIQNTTAGSIIVFHDSIKAKRNLEYCLPKILEYYYTKGYTFKSLRELSNRLYENKHQPIHH